MASPREDVHHLADLEVPPQDGVECSLARPFSEVEGELIEVRCLAAGRAGGRFAECERPRGGGFFDGALDDRREVLAEALARYLAELPAGLLHLTA